MVISLVFIISTYELSNLLSSPCPAKVSEWEQLGGCPAGSQGEPTAQVLTLLAHYLLRGWRRKIRRNHMVTATTDDEISHLSCQSWLLQLTQTGRQKNIRVIQQCCWIPCAGKYKRCTEMNTSLYKTQQMLMDYSRHMSITWHKFGLIALKKNKKLVQNQLATESTYIRNTTYKLNNLFFKQLTKPFIS